MPDTDRSNLHEELFRRCLRIRLIEDRIAAVYHTDKIQSPVHLSNGQEAVAVGVCEPLRPTDLVFPTYRSHAFFLAKGGDLNGMIAELYGRSTGVAGGKGGSMHLQAPEVGVMTASAVVASTISHAVGAALAAKLRGTGQIAVTAFGDGATEEGTYHESLNFAAVNPVPVIFLCENNGLSIHASLAERQAYRIAAHARQYGLPVTEIGEGWDFMAIRDRFAAVAAAVRAEQKAQVVVVDTFRYKEHVGPGEDFQFGYRDHAAYQAWCAKDPLMIDRERVARMTPEIEREIDAAMAFAESSAWPTADALLQDVT